MTAEEMGAAIRAGDDPTAVIRIAMAQARAETLGEAQRKSKLRHRREWK